MNEIEKWWAELDAKWKWLIHHLFHVKTKDPAPIANIPVHTDVGGGGTPPPPKPPGDGGAQ